MADAREFRVEPGWRALLNDLGLRPADVLRRAGLPEDLFSRPDARLDTDAHFRFWRALEAELDDPELPIRLVEAFSAEGFSPPLFAALCAPDLRVALGRLSRYKRLIAPMRIDLTDTEQGLEVGLRFPDATQPSPASMVITELAFLVRLARMATRSPVRARALRMPSPHPRAALEAYFGVRIEVAPTYELTFALEDVERPFLTANDSMWQAFEPVLRRRLAELDASATVGDRVRAVLLESLPSGQASMESVAKRLAVSSRTLQRRLRQEDTSYQRLLSQTRERLARHYLLNTDLSCAEIAFLLGFEEPNSFFRAFPTWTGQSPERYRAAHGAGPRAASSGA